MYKETDRLFNVDPITPIDLPHSEEPSRINEDENDDGLSKVYLDLGYTTAREAIRYRHGHGKVESHEDLPIFDIREYNTMTLRLEIITLSGRPFLCAIEKATNEIRNSSPVIDGKITRKQCKRVIHDAETLLSQHQIAV